MEIKNKINILIYLCMLCVLLFSIDSYYRDSDVPYKEIYPEEHIVANFDTETKMQRVSIAIYEFNQPKLGDYYRVNFSVGHSGGTLRVFKDEGIEYEKPLIVEEKDSCNIIIKRKGMTDLKYIIPYGKPSDETRE